MCAIAAALPNGEILTTHGTIEGRIGYEERGENGFGYDPLFIPEKNEKTFAQMTHEEKNKISHRARALKVMGKKLEDIL